MHWLIEPLQYGFMRQALVAGLLVGTTCSLLGVYVVLRRLTFLGDAVAHTTLPGLVVAYLNRWNLLLGVLLAALVTALGIGCLSRQERLREDTAIGVLFSGMFALGIVLISGTKSYRDFSHILFGNILGVTTGDLVGILLVGLVVVGTLLAFHKELVLTSVDPQHAQAMTASPRFAALASIAAGCVCGVVVGGWLRCCRSRRPPEAAAEAADDPMGGCVLLGMGLGWQAVLSVAVFALVLKCLAAFASRYILRGRRIPMLGFLFAAAVLHQILWRTGVHHAAPWWPDPSSGIVHLLVPVGCLVFLGLLVRRLRLPEPRGAAEESEVETSNDLRTLDSVAAEGCDRVY